MKRAAGFPWWERSEEEGGEGRGAACIPLSLYRVYQVRGFSSRICLFQLIEDSTFWKPNHLFISGNKAQSLFFIVPIDHKRYTSLCVCVCVQVTVYGVAVASSLQPELNIHTYTHTNTHTRTPTNTPRPRPTHKYSHYGIQIVIIWCFSHFPVTISTNVPQSWQTISLSCLQLCW